MIGVGVVFSCSHSDAVRREVHGHTYEAVAWFPDGGDQVTLQLGLANVVAEHLDHKTLPPAIGRSEDIRDLILAKMPNAISVEVNRPLERLYCRPG